jgi:hypothetical protein
MTKRHYINHRIPHYFINPITGRIIKSNSKTFEKLKKRRFIIQKDACLYDISSAKKCLSSIMYRYNGLVYPSSNFMNIPSTYDKNFKAKGFVKNKEKTHISAFVDKKGKFKKLKPEIPLKNDVVELVSLKHHKPILHKKIENSEEATIEEHNEVKEQIDNEPIKNLKLLFNPIQDDIIPIDNSIPQEEHVNIINQVNEDLIPNELPPVKETTISGLIMDSILNPMKILGFTTTENETKKLETPINIQTSKYNLPNKIEM